MILFEVRDKELQTAQVTSDPEWTTEGGASMTMEGGTSLEWDGLSIWSVAVIRAPSEDGLIRLYEPTEMTNFATKPLWTTEGGVTMETEGSVEMEWDKLAYSRISVIPIVE